jgi:hypothetical protein
MSGCASFTPQPGILLAFHLYMPGPDVNPASHTPSEPLATPRIVRPEHAEATLTRLIEQQTAKIPSHVFLSVSLAAMGVSAMCELRGHRNASHFVGMWVAPLLLMGVYNKIVKTMGTI